MPHLQVKNIPADLHAQIRSLAKRRGRTVRDLVIEAVRRELDHEQLVSRLRRRAPVRLGRPAAELLRDARAEREAER